MNDISGHAEPQQETKKERFRRIAGKRTRRVLKDLRILANCSNRSAYEYTDEDIDKISNAIDEEIRLTLSKFRRNRRVDFRL